jgi:hypothetical protein
MEVMETAMVTHKMLEILGLVARMPSSYRRIRKQELKHDFEAHLASCPQALDAFHLLIEEKKPANVSDEAIACYFSALGSVKKFVRTPVHQ